jgi:hypothetical protein
MHACMMLQQHMSVPFAVDSVVVLAPVIVKDRWLAASAVCSLSETDGSLLVRCTNKKKSSWRSIVRKWQAPPDRVSTPTIKLTNVGLLYAQRSVACTKTSIDEDTSAAARRVQGRNKSPSDGGARTAVARRARLRLRGSSDRYRSLSAPVRDSRHGRVSSQLTYHSTSCTTTQQASPLIQ